MDESTYKLIDAVIEKYHNMRTDEPSTTNQYCNGISRDLKKVKNSLELLESLKILENKYQSTEISEDFIRIFIQFRLKDIDWDTVEEILNAS